MQTVESNMETSLQDVQNFMNKFLECVVDNVQNARQFINTLFEVRNYVYRNTYSEIIAFPKDKYMRECLLFLNRNSSTFQKGAYRILEKLLPEGKLKFNLDKLYLGKNKNKFIYEPLFIVSYTKFHVKKLVITNDQNKDKFQYTTNGQHGTYIHNNFKKSINQQEEDQCAEIRNNYPLSNQAKSLLNGMIFEIFTNQCYYKQQKLTIEDFVDMTLDSTKVEELKQYQEYPEFQVRVLCNPIPSFLEQDQKDSDEQRLTYLGPFNSGTTVSTYYHPYQKIYRISTSSSLNARKISHPIFHQGDGDKYVDNKLTFDRLIPTPKKGLNHNPEQQITTSYFLFTNITNKWRIDQKTRQPKFIQVWKYDNFSPANIQWMDESAIEDLIRDSKNPDQCNESLWNAYNLFRDKEQGVIVKQFSGVQSRQEIEDEFQQAKNTHFSVNKVMI